MRPHCLCTGIVTAMLAMVCSGVRAECGESEISAIRIVYEANLSDGMGFSKGVVAAERAVGGDLGITKMVLIRGGDAQRLTSKGHRAHFVLTSQPTLKLIRVPVVESNLYNGSLIARFSESDRTGIRSRSESGPTVLPGEVRDLVRPLPSEPSNSLELRRIAGHECRPETVRRLGQIVEQCVGRVGGFEVALASSWPTLMEVGEPQWFRAVEIEASTCVSESAFEPPSWVKY